MLDVLAAQWRVGRSVGRTLYAMAGSEPGDDDMLIGLVDSERIARCIVEDHNRTRLSSFLRP